MVGNTREQHTATLTLEHVFQRPYTELVREARTTGQCTERDLLNMGTQMFRDLVRLARGEIATIHVPGRLPRAGEFDVLQ